MPVYEYKCLVCLEIEERFLMLKDFDTPQFCDCGVLMRRIISSAPAVHGQEAAWIRSMNLPLRKKGDPPIETRQDYHRVMKEKGMEHLE